MSANREHSGATHVAPFRLLKFPDRRPSTSATTSPEMAQAIEHLKFLSTLPTTWRFFVSFLANFAELAAERAGGAR